MNYQGFIREVGRLEGLIFHDASLLLSSSHSIVSIDDWKWVHGGRLPLRQNIPNSRKKGWIADNAVTVMTNFVLMSRKRKPVASNDPILAVEPVRDSLITLANTVNAYGGASTFVYDRGYTSVDAVMECKLNVSTDSALIVCLTMLLCSCKQRIPFAWNLGPWQIPPTERLSG